MKTVRIYIETSFQRPAVRDGKYASALVFTGTDGDHELIVSGTECGTTYNRLSLLGAIAAMRRLNQRCHVIMTMDNYYVTNMITQKNPEKWRRSEWKKAAGTQVQNKDLWEMFLAEKDKHDLVVEYSSRSEYTAKLQAVIHGEEI